MQLFRSIEFNVLFTKSFRSTFAIALLASFACLYLNCQLPANATRSSHRDSSAQRSSDGVTVRKNADGTVEAFDSGSAPESLTQDAGQGYRPPIVSRAYSRVIGGVHVKRNSDGTVETYEAPSRPVNLYPSVKRSKSTRHSR